MRRRAAASGSRRAGRAPLIRLHALLIALAAVLPAAGAAAQSAASSANIEAIDRAWSEQTLDVQTSAAPIPFIPPSEADIPKDEFGQMVRRGLAIFTETPAEAKPYVGDALKCSSCHLDRGGRAGSAPMWAAWVGYPRFRAKNQSVNTITMRIQGCFRFSMNGTPPPDDSEIIVALQSYFYWLARGAPTGAHLEGEGFSKIAEPHEAPSSERGAAIFAADCAACHGADGQGRRAPGGLGYQFPPLWGPKSFNWGAGLTSVATAAAFIRANMPWGLEDALSEQQAWDVAFFVDSHERPQDPRFTGSLAETRARFHDSKWSLYGTEQAGIRLGDPANYPLAESP